MGEETDFSGRIFIWKPEVPENILGQNSQIRNTMIDIIKGFLANYYLRSKNTAIQQIGWDFQKQLHNVNRVIELTLDDSDNSECALETKPAYLWKGTLY